MAALLDSAQSFVPFGRSALVYDETVLLEEEHWKLVDAYAEDGNLLQGVEDELYYRGSLVVWSRGQGDYGHQLVKSFTVDATVIDVFWCKFAGGVKTCDESSETCSHSPMEISCNSPCLCVVQARCLSLFTMTGGIFTVPVLFPIANAWPIPGGVLLHNNIAKKGSENAASSDAPQLQSLTHPLDEVKPLALLQEGEPLEKSRSVPALLDHMQPVHAFADVPLILMKERRAGGRFALYRMELLPPKKVVAASDLLDDEAEEEEESLPKFGGDFLSTTSCFGDDTTPLLSLSNRQQQRSASSNTLTSPMPPMAISSVFLPTPKTEAGVDCLPAPDTSVSSPVSRASATTRRRNMSQLRRRLQISMTSSSSNAGAARSRDLGDAASPMPLLRGPSRVLGNRRTAKPSSSRMYASAAASVVTSPMPRSSRGAWTANSSFINSSHLYSSAGSALTPTRTPRLSFASPGAYTVSRSARTLPTSVVGSTVTTALPCSGALDNDLELDICVSLSWVDSKGRLASSPAHQCFVLRDVNGQLFICFLQPELKQLISIPVSSSGAVRGQPQFLQDITGAVAVNSLGALCVSSCDGVHLVNVHGHRYQLQASPAPGLPSAELMFSNVVGSRLSVSASGSKICKRANLAEPVTNELLKMCVNMLQDVLSVSMFSHFSLFLYGGLSMSSARDSSRCWDCLLQAMCQALQLQLLPADSPAVGMDSCDDENNELELIKWVCSASSSTRGISTTSTLPRLSIPEHMFPIVSLVFSQLHLIYEDTKLNVDLSGSGTEPLLGLLGSLAYALQLPDYTRYYIVERPDMASKLLANIHPHPVSYRRVPQYPLNITHHLAAVLEGTQSSIDWCTSSVCKRSDVLCHLYAARQAFLQRAPTPATGGQVNANAINFTPVKTRPSNSSASSHEQLAGDIADSEVTHDILESLPLGFRTPVEQMLEWCRHGNVSNLPLLVCELLGRHDLLRQAKLSAHSQLVMPQIAAEPVSQAEETSDGLQFSDPHLSLLYPDDLRMTEVATLLQSTRPVLITVEQKQEASDHDHQQNQIQQLMLICQRTFALPVGRGAATLRSIRTLPTESLPIPVLGCSGRTPPPRSVVVKLREEDVQEMKWPLFHNGVASGLAMSAYQVDTKWIIHNRPQDEDKQHEHGGFLFALGLNGHLEALRAYEVCEYLTQLNIATTVGLLLGIASMRCGSRQQQTLRLLATHIASLRPPNSLAVKVNPLIQIAAVHGVGLLFMESADQHLASVFVQQIGHLPEQTELKDLYKFDRHAYSLACGVSLGMIMLGQGEGKTSTNLQLTSRLLCLLEGKHIDVKDGQQSSNSFQAAPASDASGVNDDARSSGEGLILNRNGVDCHCTSPAASLALTLMYLKTGSNEVASWLQPPSTIKELCSVRPDVLLMRTAGQHLVLWDSIEASKEWLTSQAPLILQQATFTSRDNKMSHYESSLFQAASSVQGGLCLAMGLRYAGTQDQDAFSSILQQCKLMLKLTDPSKCPEENKRVFLMSMQVMVLALSMVVAGTGNVVVLRICRLLHSRTNEEAFVYGSHLAVHMALGFAFLGGSRYSFGRSNRAIAALLCAVCPQFPVLPSDNSCHLQALRHLYVLAAEPRLLVPVDVESEEPCQIPIVVEMKDGRTIRQSAPLILPNLNEIGTVRTDSPSHWPVTMDFSADHKKCRTIVEDHRGVLFVKRRPANQWVPRVLSYTHAFPGLGMSWAKLANGIVDNADNVLSSRQHMSGQQISSFLHETSFLPVLYSMLDNVVGQLKSQRGVDSFTMTQLLLIFLAHSSDSQYQLMDNNYMSVAKAAVEYYLRRQEKISADSLSLYIRQQFDVVNADHWPSISTLVQYHRLTLSKCQYLQGLLPLLQTHHTDQLHLSLVSSAIP